MGAELASSQMDEWEMMDAFGSIILEGRCFKDKAQYFISRNDKN